MELEKIVEELALVTDSRICLVVLDGLGDFRCRDFDHKTPLDVAKTPNLDALTGDAAVGRILPVGYGVTPGSGPAHLGLFGYDPKEIEIGRGVLEAVGIDIVLGKNDVAARANFCTVKDGKIVDRRAGRPETAEAAKRCKKLQEAIPRIDDVKVTIKAGKGHRFVVVLTGEGLLGAVTDTDPHHEGEPIHESKPEMPEARKTADVINKFWKRACDALKDDHPMNAILMRGVSGKPDIPSLEDRFKLKPAAIATYPMYRGLASLVGMDLLDTGPRIEEEFQVYLDNYDKYAFFFIHIKGTDEAGEDGAFERKVSVIEDFDAALPVLLRKRPEVLAITGDHSTPCKMKLHGWHPVPLMLLSPRCGADGKPKFTEEHCNTGSLGIFESRHLMNLMLANAEKLDKFGA